MGKVTGFMEAGRRTPCAATESSESTIGRKSTSSGAILIRDGRQVDVWTAVFPSATTGVRSGT